MTFLFVAAAILALCSAWFAWLAVLAHQRDQSVRRHPARWRTAGSDLPADRPHPARRSPRSFAHYHRQLRSQMRRAERDLDRYYRNGHLR